ncbi:MAG TPA: AI-2E family transporter [Pirellulaceae bacterium]|nr:AI-2E family transporter [Pirellulaceae bacterium]
MRTTIFATLIVAAIGIAAVGIIWLRAVLLLLFAGIVLATALRPACVFLAKQTGLGEAYSAAILYLSLAGTLLGMGCWLLPAAIEQTASLAEKLPEYYAEGRASLDESSSKLVRLSSRVLPEKLPALPIKALSDNAGEGAMALVQRLALAAVGVMIVGFLAFYWTINETLTLRSLLSFTPDHRREFYRELIDVLLAKLGAYVRGQLVLCAAVFVLSLIAYYLIGLPYALVLAVVAGLLEAIPVIGPTLGAIPAVIVALSLGPQATMWVLAAAVVIQLLENYLLVPKIMDRSVGIGAVVTLLAIVAFGALFGFLGAVLAIPLAAITQTLFERLVLNRDFKDQEFAAPRDASGVVHYQLQDLIHDLRRQQRQKSSTINEFTVEAFDEIERLAMALDEIVIDQREPGEVAEPRVAGSQV